MAGGCGCVNVHVQMDGVSGKREGVGRRNSTVHTYRVWLERDAVVIYLSHSHQPMPRFNPTMVWWHKHNMHPPQYGTLFTFVCSSKATLSRSFPVPRNKTSRYLLSGPPA